MRVPPVERHFHERDAALDQPPREQTALGERAALKLWPSRDFDVGLGRGNAATPRAEVEGGAVGIIVDARGRPLSLPDGKEKRQAKLLQWLQAMRAYPQLSFVHAEQAEAG